MSDAETPDEHENEPPKPHLNPNAATAAAQGSVVPLGWKPSPSKPIPVVRCVVIKRNGDRCGRWSLRGMTKCYAHGRAELNFPNAAAHKEAVIDAARMRILDASDDAVDTLKQLLQPGTAEGIRLKAATEILDRNGIRGGFEIDVAVDHKEDPATVLAQRLLTLRTRHEESMQTIDGEVVDDADPEDESAEQDTLF